MVSSKKNDQSGNSPGGHVAEEALVSGLPEQLLDRVRLAAQAPVEPLRRVEVAALAGTQFEPRVLLLQSAERDDALARRVQHVGSYDYRFHVPSVIVLLSCDHNSFDSSSGLIGHHLRY